MTHIECYPCQTCSTCTPQTASSRQYPFIAKVIAFFQHAGDLFKSATITRVGSGTTDISEIKNSYTYQRDFIEVVTLFQSKL